MGDFQSLGDLLRGSGDNGGLRHQSPDKWSLTVGPTLDPRFPGGQYVSHTNALGEKATGVFDSYGNLVVPPNYKP